MNGIMLINAKGQASLDINVFDLAKGKPKKLRGSR